MMSYKYTVFLSHNKKDKAAVEEIAEKLKKNRIKVWYDEWEIRPGTRWQKELEKGLQECNTVLIFFGGSGIGPWHDAETEIAISRALKNCKIVFAVLLS